MGVAAASYTNLNTPTGASAVNDYRRNTWTMFLAGMVIALFFVAVVAAGRVRTLDDRVYALEQIVGVSHAEGK